MRKSVLAIILLSSTVATPAFAQAPGDGAGRAAKAAVAAEAYRSNDRNSTANFQREYESRIERDTKGGLNRYALAMTVADCLADKDKEASALVGGEMSADPMFKGLTKALGRKHKSCIVREAVGTPMTLINGALGEVLIEKADMRLADKVMPKDLEEAQKFYARPMPTMATVGRCMAVYSPGLVMKALATRPGTDAEQAAMTELYAKSPECGYTAMPTDVPSHDQRAAMAAGLYHWTLPGSSRATGGAAVSTEG